MEHEDHISSTYYRWQFLATMTWWLLIRVLMKKHLYDITNGSVFTRPSWLPHQWLHRLQAPRARKNVFVASLFAMALGGWGPQHYVVVRIVVALLVSLYHLVESSVTHRHGEYPLLYNSWAMCLPSPYAGAASWGVAIHFVFSTGLAKLLVGKRNWMAPETMRFYLTVYAQAKSRLSRPYAPTLNQWACRRPWFTSFVSVSTIALECGLVPLTLLLPVGQRWVGSNGMVLMHVGIFLLMSKQVGIVFCTTLPTYIIGFRCTVPMGTTPWWLAVAVAFLPSMFSLVLRRRLLPENWPCSPVSLFLWSGDQAKMLAETLMTKDTRVVLGTADKTASNIVGLSVVHHGAVAPQPVSNHTDKADQAVHDSVLRVIGFTLIHDELKGTIPRGEQWDVDGFVKAVQTFLRKEQRLYERQSGHPLANAFFVRLDANGKVQEVLSDGAS